MQPKDRLCRTCHDANLDVSSLNPPHVVNGRKDLAGGSFTPTLVSDGAGHNIQNRDMKLGLTPPGGGSLEVFECLSCHDAHDNNNYRNLKKEINRAHASPYKFSMRWDYSKKFPRLPGMPHRLVASPRGFEPLSSR